jgi:hypothetical protein
VAVSGFSGVGKDECAGHLVRKYGAVHTGLADPAKRHMADVYGFSYDQLFGPSHMRNAGDPRYPKNVLRDHGFVPYGTGEEILNNGLAENVTGIIRPNKKYVVIEARNLIGTDEVKSKPGWPAVPYAPLKLGRAVHFIEEDHPNFFLSPREALQLYCNLMNDLYLDSWIRKGIEVHRSLATVHQMEKDEVFMRFGYDRMSGLVPHDLNDGENWRKHDGRFFTTFSDFRHRHEISLVRRAADAYVPVVIRVKHPKIVTPPYDHRSETEQATIPDSAFDFVIMNDGTLEDLYAKVDQAMTTAAAPGWAHLSPDTRLSMEAA